MTSGLDGCWPLWSDYVWFARRNDSRLYSPIRELFRAIQAGAPSVTRSMLAALDRRRPHGIGGLAVTLLKLTTSTALGSRTKSRKYRRRLEARLQTRRERVALVAVDLMDRGPLSQLMSMHGSDKSGRSHNYTLLYDILFRDRRHAFRRVLEVGIGTNNVDIPSNMGPHGIPGASLRAWRDYFPNAIVFGGDVDERILFAEDRIRTGVVDQRSPESIARMFEQFGAGFDLILDDGLHTPEANRVLFALAFPQLKPGAFYVIEDIERSEWPLYQAFLAESDAALVRIPNEINQSHNCVAIAVRA